MAEIIEDNNYQSIDDVIENEGSDTTASLPILSQSTSVSSHTGFGNNSPGRVRSESLFTRSAITTSKRPISILDDDSGVQRMRDIPHRVENTRGHAFLAIKFAESGNVTVPI